MYTKLILCPSSERLNSHSQVEILAYFDFWHQVIGAIFTILEKFNDEQNLNIVNLSQANLYSKQKFM